MGKSWLLVALLLVAIGLAANNRSASALDAVVGIDAGAFHTCVLTSQGGAKCWGANTAGQLGRGQGPGSWYVAGLGSGVAAVSAGGEFTCAVLLDGSLKCWGLNSNGQLGDGTTTNRTIPVDVEGTTVSFTAVSAGLESTCGLTTGAGVMCWGANYAGQLGDGTTVEFSTTPVAVVGLGSGVSAVGVGADHACALSTKGNVKCWGANDVGQLGDGTTDNRATPVDVVGLSGVSGIAVGLHHTCALTTTGTAKCWGLNYTGQLGDGTTDNRTTPVDVEALGSGVGAVVAGWEYTCASMLSHGVKCWGTGLYGQLGNGTLGVQPCYCSTTPVDVLGMANNAAAVAAGESFACAVTTSGGVRCWGYNIFAQLGDGTNIDSTIPVNVLGLADLPDSDGDGCPNGREIVQGFGAQNSGGNRDSKNPHDYFNPTHDGENRIDDVLAVVGQYFKDDDDGNPGLPPYEPGYNPDTDRTALGPNASNLGPPNGQQRLDDILAIIKQYFHDCL